MILRLAAGLLLSTLVGLSLGLLGGGGSILTLPILVWVLQVPPHQAVAMSSAVVGITSFVGALLHQRRGTVDFPQAALFGLCGIPGAFFGSWFKYLFSPQTLLVGFAFLMLCAGTAMMAKARISQNVAEGPANPFKAAAVGLGVGFLTGLLGIGGGFMIVPALVLFGGSPLKNAVRTSLWVIAANCFSGFIGDLRHGDPDFRLTALVILFSVSGTVFGVSVSSRCSGPGLRRGFGVFVMLLALMLCLKECLLRF